MSEHHYTSSLGAANDRLVCACGHAEPLDDGIGLAIERMNTHIRESYTDEEWDAMAKKMRLATLDTAAGILTMPKGKRS